LKTSADLEEDAVDLSTPAPARQADAGTSESETTMPSAESNDKDDTDPVTAPVPVRPDIPTIRAEGLVPSTLPHNEDEDVGSDVSQPPSPRSTAAQASDTSPSLSRVGSTLSIGSAAGTEKSAASRVTQASSLRVETGIDDDDVNDKPETTNPQDGSQRRNVQEDQDNMSDVSTPTGTPTMPQREFLPEIPGSQNHPIGGLSLHPDGSVSPGAFGSVKKMPLSQHDVMVDTSAIPDETQKLKNEQAIHADDAGLTETEMNEKGNEPQSQGDFKITEDKMVHIELPEDDPALTEEGRELQRKAKEKLHAEAENRGTSEWGVLEEDSKDKPDQVKREQESANMKETGDRNTSFDEVHEQHVQETRQKAEREEKDEHNEGGGEPPQASGNVESASATHGVGSKDFGTTAPSDDTAVTETKTTMPFDGDKGEEPESPMSNETREHMFDEFAGKEDQECRNDANDKGELRDSFEGLQTPTEVIEPPTPMPDPGDDTRSSASDEKFPLQLSQGESTEADDAGAAPADDNVQIQDIEDIPTNDDTEMHKKDQDPNVDSLIAGKSGDNPGVEPKVKITEQGDSVETLKQGKPIQLDVEPAPYVAPRHGDAPASPASIPSDIQEPDNDIGNSGNMASASFPSVPKQEPTVSEISHTSDISNSNEISRSTTPGTGDIKLPSVPQDDIEQDDSPQGKVRVGVTLSPGKHLSATQGQSAGEQDSERGQQLDADMKRFLAKADGSDVEGKSTQAQASSPSLDALGATMSNPAAGTGLAKSTSSSSTLSSSSSSSKKKRSQERGRSPLLDMDIDGEDGGEAGWAKVSVNKTKYS